MSVGFFLIFNQNRNINTHTPSPQILDFTKKIRLFEVALFHVGNRTDGHGEADGDFSQLFCERAPLPTTKKN